MKVAGPWGDTAQPAIDLSLDLRGEVCPHPVMLTLEQLGRMEQGQILQVIVDCPSAFVNIPAEVDRHGHRLIGEPMRHGAEAIMLIRCNRAPPRPRRQFSETGSARQATIAPDLA